MTKESPAQIYSTVYTFVNEAKWFPQRHTLEEKGEEDIFLNFPPQFLPQVLLVLAFPISADMYSEIPSLPPPQHRSKICI